MIHSVKDTDKSTSKSSNIPEQNPLEQHDFMRLMGAQVQSHNLKQPQVNGEFLLQLAQFTSNDGLANIQNTLHKLVSSLQSNQALQASALVGRKVLVKSKNLNLADKGDVKVAIDMPPSLRNLSASIYLKSGER